MTTAVNVPNAAPVVQKMSFVDRWLAVWILLAMGVGLALGRFVPGLNTVLDSLSIGGISLPIALGLLVMMYPVLAKVRYDETQRMLNRLRFCAAVIRAATRGFGLRSRLPRSVLVAPSLGYRGDGGYCTNQPIPRWRIPRLRWTDTDRNGTPWCRCIRLYTVR